MEYAGGEGRRREGRREGREERGGEGRRGEGRELAKCENMNDLEGITLK